MTPLIPPDTMLVAPAAAQTAGQAASGLFAWAAAMVVSSIGIAAVAGACRGVPVPKWGGWFPRIHPEDRAFCHRCGAHVGAGAAYDAHAKACR